MVGGSFAAYCLEQIGSVSVGGCLDGESHTLWIMDEFVS